MVLGNVIFAIIFGVISGFLNGAIDISTTNKRFTEIERSMESFRKEMACAFDDYQELVEEINGTLAAMHESGADNE